MNKRLFIPVSFLLVALLVTGCSFQVVAGSGKVVTETRDVSNFSRVTLAGIGNLILTQGESESLKIEADDNLISYFKTEVQGNTLTIGLKDEYMGVMLQPTKPIKFYLTVKDLEAVTLAGSGNINADALKVKDFGVTLAGSGNISVTTLSAAKVDIHLAGSGDVAIDTLKADELTSNTAGSGNIIFQQLTVPAVNVTIIGSGDARLGTMTATSLYVSASGSGNVSATGKVTDQHITTIGSGDYQADAVQSQSATVQVSGSGSSRVGAVSETLDVRINGSGNVYYSGRPSINTDISGSGKVRSTD